MTIMPSLRCRRLEFGRYDPRVSWRKPYITGASPRRWAEWVRNLKLLASRPGNTVAANSMYDVHYIKYHTGIDALYIPSWCGPEPDVIEGEYKYEPGRSVLIGPYRDNLGGTKAIRGKKDKVAWAHPILQKLTATVNARRGRVPYQLKRVSDLYSKYTWAMILRHPAIVIMPYQTSTISFFEYYRRNIPMFVPSLSLLVRWTQDHGIMWERIYGQPQRESHASMASEAYDPNSNDNRSLHEWLGYSDYYHFPHVTKFDSWEHLLQLLEKADLNQISSAMKDYNAQTRLDLEATWKSILERAAAHSRGALVPSYNFDEVRSHAGWNCTCGLHGLISPPPVA